MPQLLNTPLFSDANLVHYYKLENTSDSKGSNTLTNVNSVAFNAAKFGNGADFGASNTTKELYSTVAPEIDGGAGTLIFWVKLQTEIASGAYCLGHVGNDTSKTSLYL